MQSRIDKKVLAPVLEDLLDDSRLVRLFSIEARNCALQLWILQINAAHSIENRVLYGRLVPYSYSSNSWSASDDDNFREFGQAQAQVVRLNLYVQSIHCAELVRQLCAGRSIAAVSEVLNLAISDKLKLRFGDTALAADELVFRPVAYLLNRDAYDRDTTSSPHGGAGALSASIVRTNKSALFHLVEGHDVALTKFVVDRLNADTGLEFSGADTARFGELELMVFPALDDLERSLLTVHWTDVPRTLIARFNPIHVPDFSGFQFHLSIADGGQIYYSGIATAERNAEGVFECKFELSEQLHARTDSTELELFGFHSASPQEGTLCCRWRVGYVREIHFQMQPIIGRTGPVKFDWLERATRPSEAARVQAALTINRNNPGFSNQIGGREADPWVSANQDIASLFTRLHPSKSEGQFFLRWGQGDGEGRLQFVEWFKKLLAKYHEHQVVIFDPYFEDAGLALMLLCAASKSEYVVFTSLPKPSKDTEAVPGEADKPTPGRINSLLASCEHNRHLLKRINLRIFGMKDGRLHDRYILIMGPDGLPVAGFNLSNSFQKAAEHFPLLVTPIPSDTLLKVERYKSELLREAKTAQSGVESENRSMRLLFDSAASVTAPRRYEPLRFLEKVQAGDVLGLWAGEPSLQGLSGDPLKERMIGLGLLNGDALALPEKAGLRDCLDKQIGDFADFADRWDMLGEVLAHSRAGNGRFYGLEAERGFLEFLSRFLEASFDRTHDVATGESAVIDTRLFREPFEILLHKSHSLEHLFHATKYAALTWSEYFTIKFLWWYAPSVLLSIAETQMGKMPIEPQGSDVIRLSLLSQIVSEISLSVQFDIDEGHRDLLLHSQNGALQWLGLNAIERALEKPDGLATALQLVASLSDTVQVQALGWTINRAARNVKKDQIYNDLVAALHRTLPKPILATDLKLLVDSLRGHMGQLSWAEPWLFRDVVSPLLEDGRADTDDACEIWIQELADWLERDRGQQSRLFEPQREGQTTNVAAFLLAHSSPERRQVSLKSIQSILKRQQQILRQPLASTSDWTRWNDALTVSMWILTFTRWSQYYLRGREMADAELESLSVAALDLAMIRPMSEWRLTGVGQQGQLASVLDQIEKLLASNEQAKN